MEKGGEKDEEAWQGERGEEVIKRGEDEQKEEKERNEEEEIYGVKKR